MIDQHRRTNRLTLFRWLGVAAGAPSAAKKHTTRRVQWERRLGVEPIEERLLLSVTPVTDPQASTLQTLSTTALVSNPTSPSTTRGWATDGWFYTGASQAFDYACGSGCPLSGTGAGSTTTIVASTGSSNSALLTPDGTLGVVLSANTGQAAQTPAAQPALRIANSPSATLGSAPTATTDRMPTATIGSTPALRPADSLPEASRISPLRITATETRTTPSPAAMIDIAPRVSEQFALAMAQAVYRQQVAAQSQVLPVAALGQEQRTGTPAPVDARQHYESRMDTPTPNSAKPLHGEQGRAQAFDLAQLTPSRSSKAAGAMPVTMAAPSGGHAMQAMLNLALPDQPTLSHAAEAEAGPSATREAVFAEMLEASAEEDPARLDIDFSRRAVALLAVAMLAAELLPRSTQLDEGGTYLYPLVHFKLRTSR